MSPMMTTVGRYGIKHEFNYHLSGFWTRGALEGSSE
jgi:hypothetical protein